MTGTTLRSGTDSGPDGAEGLWTTPWSGAPVDGSWTRKGVAVFSDPPGRN